MRSKRYSTLNWRFRLGGSLSAVAPLNLSRSKPAISNTQYFGQRGIATILIVVLIGVGMTVVALGLVHAGRATQEKQAAVHALTHSQNSVWLGVEAFRRYLNNLDATTISSLHGTPTVDIGTSAIYGNLTANNITVTPVGSNLRVSANILSYLPAAKSSASLEVVFDVNNTDSCPGCVVLSSALNFYDDLNGQGQVGFDGTPTINVDGNVDLSSINIDSFGALNATGNVKLHSNVAVDSIHVNGDVDIVDAKIKSIRSRGSVTLDSTASAETIEANGAVNHYAQSNTQRIDSLDDVLIGAESGAHTLVRAGGRVAIENEWGQASGSVIGELFAVSTVSVNSPSAVINNIFGEADLTCPAGAWSGYGVVHLNSSAQASCTNILADFLVPGQTDIVIPAAVTVNLMSPVPEFKPPPARVDVFTLKDEANYVVEHVGSKVKVTVRNINGDADGAEFYVGKHKGEGSKSGALCNQIDGGGNCICPDASTPGCGDYERYVCLGDSIWNACLEYKNNRFEVYGSGIAPGVWWFDGDVFMQNGYNNATLLATGNIASNGQYRGAAVNYGYEPVVYNVADRDKSKRIPPYDQICEARGEGLKERASHMVTEYQTRFAERYPSNLCDKASGTYLATNTGNIALAAGGIRPLGQGGDGSTYSGGDIEIGANSQVMGSTLAGGYLNAGDSTTFFGYVMAAVQGDKRSDGATKNSISGYTKIILDTATDYYAPDTIPDMGTPPCHSGCGGGGAPATDKASVLWTRYQ